MYNINAYLRTQFGERLFVCMLIHLNMLSRMTACVDQLAKGVEEL
jgi:hypothetical protein